MSLRRVGYTFYKRVVKGRHLSEMFHCVKHFVINVLALLVGFSYRNFTTMKDKTDLSVSDTRMKNQGIKQCQRCLTKDSKMELRERLARVSREVARLLPLSNVHGVSEE
jgi:hypothetical protein